MQVLIVQQEKIINKMVKSLAEKLDALDMRPADKEEFLKVFEMFKGMESKYIDWDKIQKLHEDRFVVFNKEELASSLSEGKKYLSKIAVCKLNGGLGTTMGCTYPKSLIEVTEGKSFISCVVSQVKQLNEKFGTNIPLVLMNSENTSPYIKDFEKDIESDISLFQFQQSNFPRIWADSHNPIPKGPFSLETKDEWYPPGHADVLLCLLKEPGLIEKLIEKGVEYLFVSNVDNLMATVNPLIAKAIIDKKADIAFEVTPKTVIDVKGGTFVEIDNKLQLMEMAQVPPEHLEDFLSLEKFRIFNTNNVWINLKSALAFRNKDLELQLIVNEKMFKKKKVIQLERAVGSSISNFDKPLVVEVPRNRFMPVKANSDLLLLKSSIFNLEGVTPILKRKSIPLIKLDSEYSDLEFFLKKIPHPLNMDELTKLCVYGDVSFGKGVVLVVGDFTFLCTILLRFFPRGGLLSLQMKGDLYKFLMVPV